MTKVGSIANEYDSVLVWSSSSGYFSSYYVTTHWHCICCYVLLWKTRNKRRKRKICPKRKKIKIYATMKVGFPSTLVKLKSVGAKYCKNSYSLHMCDVTFWFSKKSSLFPPPPPRVSRIIWMAPYIRFSSLNIFEFHVQFKYEQKMFVSKIFKLL